MLCLKHYVLSSIWQSFVVLLEGCDILFFDFQSSIARCVLLLQITRQSSNKPTNYKKTTVFPSFY